MQIHEIHKCGGELYYNTIETLVKLGNIDVVVVVSDCYLEKLGVFTVACFNSDEHGRPYLCAPLSIVRHIASSGTDDLKEANELLEFVCDQLKQTYTLNPLKRDTFDKVISRALDKYPTTHCFTAESLTK